MSPSDALVPTADAVATVVPLVDACLRFNAGVITDFGEQRNRMLADAAEAGCDWALMLDTDERIICRGGDCSLRDRLATSSADVLMVPHVSGTYEKERLFRLPVKGHYHGRTHEAFIMDAGAIRRTIRGLLFDEVPKTPEAYRAKVERDLPLLKAMTEENPDDPRWFYYLGDTYSGLGQVDEALAAFAQCWQRNGWDEESAWAAYRIAELECGRQGYVMAIHWCTKGMQRHPGMSELPWLAGWCCYQMGQFQKAIWWEEMAFALTKIVADNDRIGFRYPPALYEGPHDVMRHAYRALGDTDGEMVAEERFQRYVGMRAPEAKIADPSREG